MAPQWGKENESGGEVEEEAEIYVRTVDGRGDGYYWCRINRHQTPTNISMKSYLPHGVRWGSSSIAALGSTIYSVGGNTRPESSYRFSSYTEDSANLLFLNTSSARVEWTPGASMKKPRPKPYVVPLPDGRLLAFGPERDRPYAEIYDPKYRAWASQKSLPDPNVYHPCIAGHAIFGNKILFHAFGGGGSLYSYDIEEDYWQLYSSEFGKMLGSSALIDDIMYLVGESFMDPFLFAYNFENFNQNYDKEQRNHPLSPNIPVEWLPRDDHVGDDVPTTEWLPERKPGRVLPTIRLLAVGEGKLAVVWAHHFGRYTCVNKYGFADGHIKIMVSIFNMTKTRNPGDGSLQSLSARPVSHKRYLAQGLMFEDCVAVFKSQKVQAREDLDYSSNQGQMKPLKNKKRNGKKK